MRNTSMNMSSRSTPQARIVVAVRAMARRNALRYRDDGDNGGNSNKGGNGNNDFGRSQRQHRARVNGALDRLMNKPFMTPPALRELVWNKYARLHVVSTDDLRYFVVLRDVFVGDDQAY